MVYMKLQVTRTCSCKLPRNVQGVFIKNSLHSLSSVLRLAAREQTKARVKNVWCRNPVQFNAVRDVPYQL